jgi:DNA repair exonuclease SbcCD ATPase subunit
LKRVQERHSAAAERRDITLRRARAPQSATQDLDAGVNALSSLLPDGVSLVERDFNLERVAELGQVLDRLVSALELQQHRAVRLEEREQVTEAVLTVAERSMDAAHARASDATVQAPVTVQLAAAALKLLGDACPVCGQAIDEETVRQHLEEVLASSERMAALAQSAQDDLARARTELADVRERARVRREAEDALELARSAVEDQIRSAADVLHIRRVPPGEPGEYLASLTRARDALSKLHRDVVVAGTAHLERLQSDTDALAAEVAALEGEVTRLEERCLQAKELERAAHQAAENIVQRALDALQPSFAEVFDRINPNPAFTKLLARQDIFRNRNQVVPVVRDVERNIDANPLLVFSEGQLNVVALSYFLGMALNAQDGAVPFLVLDDPLQALDVIAMLGFSDLCRRIRDARQLIVTTHDQRFADVLVRKLSPREPESRTIVLDFEGWTREGPIIRTAVPEPAEVIPLFQRRAS